MNSDDRENRIIRDFSPYILVIALNHEVIEGLDVRTIGSILDIITFYLFSRENNWDSHAWDYKNELLAVATLLILAGLKKRSFPTFGHRRLNTILKFVPNPFGLQDPRAVFDDPGFAVPDLLNEFDSDYIREIMQGFIIEWLNIFRGSTQYLPYQCARLLLGREGLTPANEDLLRWFVETPHERWKTTYFEALVREFKFAAEFRASLREESKKISI